MAAISSSVYNCIEALLLARWRKGWCIGNSHCFSSIHPGWKEWCILFIPSSSCLSKTMLSQQDLLCRIVGYWTAYSNGVTHTHKHAYTHSSFWTSQKESLYAAPIYWIREIQKNVWIYTYIKGPSFSWIEMMWSIKGIKYGYINM